MKKIALTIAGLCLVIFLASQNCGTLPPQQAQQFSYDPSASSGLRKYMKQIEKGRYLVFDVQYYLVRQRQSPEVLTSQDLEHATNRLNNHFSGAAVTFRQTGDIEAIENDKLAFFHSSSEVELQRHKKGKKVIHVFIVEALFSDDEGNLDGYTYHPDDGDLTKPWQENIILIDRNKILDESTLSHEMGHFFGLKHTHEFAGTEKAELVSRHRCKELGDGICDTPADPDCTNCVDGNGRFVCPRMDKDGNFFKPMVGNIMSYAQPEFRNQFTPGQDYIIQQTALYKRHSLIAKTSTSRGADILSIMPLNLAGAYEQYKYGGPDKVLLLFQKDSSMWSTRVKMELAFLVHHDFPFANLIEHAGEQYTLIVWDADQPDRFIPDFIGNDLFHQPNEIATVEYGWLSMSLAERMIMFPALLVIQFTDKQEFDYQIKNFYPGYYKPREVSKILSHFRFSNAVTMNTK